jgi:hypothetical protein
VPVDQGGVSGGDRVRLWLRDRRFRMTKVQHNYTITRNDYIYIHAYKRL